MRKKTCKDFLNTYTYNFTLVRPYNAPINNCNFNYPTTLTNEKSAIASAALHGSGRRAPGKDSERLVSMPAQALVTNYLLAWALMPDICLA